MKIIKSNFKDYRFKPQWKFSLLTFLFVFLFVSLGFWQLDRAKEKKLLQQTYDQQQNTAALQLSQITQDIAHYRYAAVQLTGVYDNLHSFLIDNKFYEHQPGYQVLTPFIVDQQDKMILINRGWIPMGLHREVIPSIPTVLGKQTLHGFVYLPEKPFLLGKLADQTTTWPRRTEAIQVTEFAKLLKTPLYSFVILLAPDVPNGFIRHWQPVTISSQKHIGYAIQWFSFAFILLIIFIYLNIRQKNEQ